MKNIENSAYTIRGTTLKATLLALVLAVTAIPGARAGEETASTGPTASASSTTNDDGSTTITIKFKNGTGDGSASAASSTAASSTASADRLKFPSPMNPDNPHAVALKKAHARALAAYTRLWQDYHRPRWDMYRYIINLITYTRIYRTYYSELTRYHRWEDENQRSFSGRVVFYPPGAVPPPPSPDPLAATPATDFSSETAAAPSTAAFPSTSSVTDTGKGSGTASSDDWTKDGKDSVDKIGPTSTPFTGNETVVTSTAASSTANTSPSSLTLDPSQPVAGAKVEVSLNINYIRDPGPDGYPRKETTTDARGGFAFENLQQGVWTYTVTAPGFATKTGTFEVKDGKIYQDIVMEQQAERHPVAGTVFTVQAVFLSESLRNLINESDSIDASLLRQIESHLSGGNGRSYPLYLRPVRDQAVSLTRTDPVIAIYPPPPVESHVTKTDASGTFSFTDLKGESYRLDVTRDGYKPYSVEVNASQKSEDLRIILIEENPEHGDTPLITE